MLGFILGIILWTLGLYLSGSCLLRKLRCQTFVSATVALGCSQETLRENGCREKNRFPQYRFSLQGKEYMVIDYNAPRSATLRTGDLVQIFCDASRPDRCWYTAGTLWKDALWGSLSLLGAVCVTILFLI